MYTLSTLREPSRPVSIPHCSRTKFGLHNVCSAWRRHSPQGVNSLLSTAHRPPQRPQAPLLRRVLRPPQATQIRFAEVSSPIAVVTEAKRRVARAVPRAAPRGRAPAESTGSVPTPRASVLLSQSGAHEQPRRGGAAFSFLSSLARELRAAARSISDAGSPDVPACPRHNPPCDASRQAYIEASRAVVRASASPPTAARVAVSNSATAVATLWYSGAAQAPTAASTCARVTSVPGPAPGPVVVVVGAPGPEGSPPEME